MSLDSLVDKTEIIKTERISSDLDDDGTSDTRLDRVDDEDLPYLQVVFDQVARIPKLEAQAEALKTRADGFRGASDSYLLYLFDKYGYDPATTSIERDGRFVVRG